MDLLTVYEEFQDWRARLYQSLGGPIPDDVARALAGDMRQALGRLEARRLGQQAGTPPAEEAPDGP